MTRKEIAVKQYVIRLDAEERDRLERVDLQRRVFRQLERLVRSGARLLKAAISDAGDVLSDGRR